MMSKKELLSVLDFEPGDLIREVSVSAIDYYAKELSALRLPDKFMSQNKNAYDIKHWSPSDRLRGKFGRFVVYCEDGTFPDTDIVMMGSVIGLGGLDRDYGMRSLRHYELRDGLYAALVERGLAEVESLHTRAVDYGATSIALDKSGTPESVALYGQSLDYGRADAIGRQKTCDVFQAKIGESIEVINQEPQPRERQQIIKQ